MGKLLDLRVVLGRASKDPEEENMDYLLYIRDYSHGQLGWAEGKTAMRRWSGADKLPIRL